MLCTDYKYCDMFGVGVRDVLKSWDELLMTQREFGTEVSINLSDPPPHAPTEPCGLTLWGNPVR